jgi:hypothetical protein
MLLAAGCTNYYRITDQASRRIYYAKGYDRTESGAVKFYDPKSRADVTLQNSEVVEVSKQDYEAGLRR